MHLLRNLRDDKPCVLLSTERWPVRIGLTIPLWWSRPFSANRSIVVMAVI